MKKTRHTVLCVDDETQILSSLKRLLRKEKYELITATNGEDGLKAFNKGQIHLVISDHRMPGMSGTSFLARIRDAYPDTLRILLTGYTEIESIKESINQGNIYKFFLKPWNDENLKIEIRKSLEQYDLIQSNRSLALELDEKNKALRQINQDLETLVAKRTRELELQNQMLELTRNIFESLPIPVMGLSPDQTVILLNRQAGQVILNGLKVNVGASLKKYFSKSDIQKLKPVFDLEKDKVILSQIIGSKNYRITLSSLKGRFAGTSFILSFQKPVV